MDILKRFTGKAALITGGGSGIGRASGIRLGAEGASVAVADINESTAQEACKAITSAGGRAIPVVGDVTDKNSNIRMVEETVKAFGKLDILVTCAGVGAGGNVDTVDEDAWKRVMSLDLDAVYMISRYAIPEMRKAGGGAICHIASIGGLCGMSGASFCAAKGAVVNLTRQMGNAHAKEKIRVNCIAPGVIDTPLVQGWLDSAEGKRRSIEQWHPMDRLGTAAEVAAAVAFLCADEASFITGTALPVDGGYMSAGRR